MDLKLAIFKPMLKLAMERTGHGAALGFELTKVGRGEVEMTFPYKAEVVDRFHHHLNLHLHLHLRLLVF